MTEARYRIAGVTFSIVTDGAWNDEPRWSRFRDDCAISADFTCRIHWVSTFPTFAGKLLAQGDTCDVLQTETGLCRAYYDLTRSKLRAYTLERERHMEVYLLHENAPWGTNARELFRQLAFPHTLLQHQRLLLHGAYIETDGMAIVFTAPSGTGKTTQAELWRQYRGAQIVNGDRVILGMDNGRAHAYGVPHSGASDECENRTLPLRAVISLSQARENTVKTLPHRDALRALLRGSYLPSEYRMDLTALLDLAGLLSVHIPVLHLACLPEESAVVALENALRAAERTTLRPR